MSILGNNAQGIGSAAGAAIGSVIPGIGTMIGGALGGAVSGLFGSDGAPRPYSMEPNYWNYPGYLPPGSRQRGYTGPSRANWLSGVWKSPKGENPPTGGSFTPPKPINLGNGLAAPGTVPAKPAGFIDVQNTGVSPVLLVAGGLAALYILNSRGDS